MDWVKLVEDSLSKIWSDMVCLSNFIKKETVTQVFFCEFCKIFKNTFFYRTPLVAASACWCFWHYCWCFFFIILVNILSIFFVANSNFEFSLVFATISSTLSDVTWHHICSFLQIFTQYFIPWYYKDEFCHFLTRKCTSKLLYLP